MAKTKIFFSHNVQVQLANQISSCYGYAKVSSFGMYLGVPILSGRITKATYGYILDKFRNRLSGWAVSKPSMAGRVTLIHAILSTIPLYAMQTSVLPISLCNELHRLIRNFLWGSSSEVRKIHNVSWSVVTKPKEYRGLNVKPSRIINQAFLLKLGWRLITQTSSLWARVLAGKYIKSTTLDFSKTKHSNLSPLWRGILDTVGNLRPSCAVFIGNRETTSFLCDNWLEAAGPLSPHLIGSISDDV